MHFEALIEPLDGKLPKVTYKWDPETDILVATCKGVAKGSGMNGSVDLEGADGSFVLLDIASGALRGVEVVSWPDDVRTMNELPAPDTVKEARVVFPTRRSQPGAAAVEVDTPLTAEKNAKESVFHLRVGPQRPARAARRADPLPAQGGKQRRLPG